MSKRRMPQIMCQGEEVVEEHVPMTAASGGRQGQPATSVEGRRPCGQVCSGPGPRMNGIGRAAGRPWDAPSDSVHFGGVRRERA